MPAIIVNPATPAQGPEGAPVNPLARTFRDIVGAYAQQFPTQMERAQMNLQNAETSRIQQQMGTGDTMANIVNSIYTPKMMAPPGPPDMPGVAPIESPQAPSTDDSLKRNAGSIFKAAFDSGHPELSGGLYRAVTANAPGVTTHSKDGSLDPVSASQIGAGEGYGATGAGIREERQLGTPEMRNREYKIQQIMHDQNANRKQAEAVVDGILEPYRDPTTGNLSLVNKIDQTTVPLHSPAQNYGSSGSAAPAAASPQANSAPAGVDPNLATAANKYGIDPALAHGIYGAESTFGRNPNPSKAGALGPMQMLPGTAKDMGVDPNNPAQAFDGSMKYFKQNMDKYHNPTLALMAYNWGPTSVDGWLASGADPAKVPAETREYLAKVNLYASAVSHSNPQPSAEQPPSAQAAPAAPARPQMPQFTAEDLNFNPQDAVGPINTLKRFANLNGGEQRLNLASMSDFERRAAEADAAQRGVRNSSTLTKLSSEGLPEADPTLEGAYRTALQDPKTSATLVAKRLNDEIANRNSFERQLADPNTPLEERKNLENAREKIDILARQSLKPTALKKYLEATGQSAAVSGEAPAAQMSNMEQGAHATVVPPYEVIPGGDKITDEDIMHTAKLRNMTPTQVIEKLRAAKKVR